jgi:hypothetical protein
MRRRLVAVLAATLMACSNSPPADAGTQLASARDGTIDPAILALMDSASAAYRERDYAAASRYFASAASLDSSLAAPWFGLFLAERALGRPMVADSALRAARRLSIRE